MVSRTRRPRPALRIDYRWLIGLIAVAAAVAVFRALPRSVPEPPLQLVALGPDGRFSDTLAVPGSWGDTLRTTGLVRVPLVLAVRNTGERPASPERLSLSLPARYRLTDPEGELGAEAHAGSPLVRYTFPTGLAPVQPGRLPTLLPDRDTLWLDVMVPSYYCVALADSVPELIPAAPPSLSTLSEVRIFYSLDGGDLTHRRTGTLTVRLDTALLHMEMPGTSPAFPVVMDSATAMPDVGELQLVGRRTSQCGEPRDPMELRSTLWLTDRGGRVIALELGGVERKRLYDLDGDGVIERESWDADGDGVFEATRRSRLSTPEFLLPPRTPLADERDTVPASGG